MTSGSTLLPENPPFISKFAIKELQNLHVDIKFGAKVVAVTPYPDGRQELNLSNGTKIIADLYIPTFGLAPNSSYIPSKFLNKDGYVLVDDHLALKGAKDVFAIGDVSAVEPSQFIYCDKQSSYLAKNIILLLSSKPLLSYKAATTRKSPPVEKTRKIQIADNTGIRYDGISSREEEGDGASW